MAKIERYDGNVEAFASESLGTERTVFGGTTQSDDLSDQLTSAFLRGWGIVGASDFPSLQDFSGAMFTATQFISYLHQMGVAEWDAAQEYETEGACCVYSGDVWKRGTSWSLGDEPGVSGSWFRFFDSESIATSAEITSGAGGNVVTPSELANSEYGFGVGASYTDITSSVISGTTYTNTSGKAIFISALVITNSGTTNGEYLRGYVDDDKVKSVGNNASGASIFLSVSFIVPNGSSWRIQVASATLNKVMELS